MIRGFHLTRIRNLRWLTCARVDQRGVAAVEFAIILPLMLLIYAGAVDITRGVIASRKLDQLARTVSDLVSQQPASSSLDPATINSIFAASSAVMAPYNTSSLKITVSAVDVQYDTINNVCCKALVRWSYTKNGVLRTCPALTQVANGISATSTNIPKALITANVNAGYGYSSTKSSYLVVSDAVFTYTPLFQPILNIASMNMRKTMWMVPRATSGAIKLTSPATAPSSSNGNTGGAICLS